MAAILGYLQVATASPGSTANEFTLFWCVSDVQPGETMMCGLGSSGAGGAVGANVTLRIVGSGSGTPAYQSTVPATISPSGDAVSAVVPLDAPFGVMAVQLLAPVSATVLSNVFTVNAPEVWWVQGDAGEAASPGGWVRAFGRGLTLPVPWAALGGEGALRGVAGALARATDRADWAAVGVLAARVQLLAAHQAELRLPSGGVTTTLNLTSSAGVSTVLPASPQRLTSHSAEFAVPASLPAGRYSIPGYELMGQELG